MVTFTYTTTVLKASEGYVLIQANIDNVEQIIFSDKVYLSALDSPDNWKEITIEEADMIKQQQEVALKEATSQEESNMIES